MLENKNIILGFLKMGIEIKNQKEFEKIIDKKKYEVFFLSCRFHLYWKFNFICHNHIVINKLGKLDRWEVHYSKNMENEINDKKYLLKTMKKFNHIYKNFVSPVISFLKYPTSISSERFLVKLVKKFDDEKLCKKIIKFVENTPKNYPYRNKYISYPGPNSNTYIQYIIDELNLDVKLSVNSFGKNYKYIEKIKKLVKK